MKLRTTALAITALLAMPFISIANASAATTPALDAFNAAFAKTNAFTYKLHSHEVKGTDSQDRVYQYSFLKPSDAKTLIESGAGAGSGGVWKGGDQVSGHQGGMLSRFHLKVGLHDGRAVSLLGYTIPDGLPQTIVASYQNIKGTLKQTDNAGSIGGGQTDMVELTVLDPNSNNGITDKKIYFSQSTHFPVREIVYAGTVKILDQSFTDWNLNAQLKDPDDFPF